MSKVYDTWEALVHKLRYGLQMLEVAGSDPVRLRNWQGDNSGHAFVDGKTRAASAIAYHASVSSDVDLTGSGDGHCRRIIVGTAGALVVTVGGEDTTIPTEILEAFPVLDIEATAIVASGTTAAKILVMW